MREIWRILCWPFHFLAQGKWPHVDWDNKSWTPENPTEIALAGTDLADGPCAVIYGVLGDLDHMAKSYKLRHYNANLMCDLRPANREETVRASLYNNFDRDAQWPQKLYSSEQWRALYDGHVYIGCSRLGASSITIWNPMSCILSFWARISISWALFFRSSFSTSCLAALVRIWPTYGSRSVNSISVSTHNRNTII